MQDGTARSTRKVKLTDRNVRILPAVNGRTDYTDELVRGFRLRVGTDGSRVYSVGYFAGGRWKRYTIGRVGDLTLGTTPDGVLVDIGLKMEGLIPKAEFPDFEKSLPFKEGDHISVLIRRVEGQDHHSQVSWRAAREWILQSMEH